MRRTVYVISLVIFFSFAWGVWYGFTPPEEGFDWFEQKLSLKVLAPTDIVSKELISELKDKEGLTIELVEKDSGIDLLRELLRANQNYDLVLFSSFLSDSVILDHYFSQLDRSHIQLEQNISVDFMQLNFDPSNAYSVPLLWGVNGWLVPKDAKEKSLSLKNHKKFKVLHEPAELFGLATKLKPIVRTWVETGQVKKLKEMASFFKNFNSKDGIQQIKSGELTAELLEKHDFKLAEERSHLWIIHAAISKNSENKRVAEEALNMLISPQWSLALANGAKAATINKALNSSDELPEYRKASYIRKLPISQIELFSSHEAYEPIFMSILQKSHPLVFN